MLPAELPNRPPESAFLMQHLALKTVRPSLLDLRFTGDAWIVAGDDGLALFFGNYRLASIQGSDLDLPSLNNLLDRARHQRPRWREVIHRYRPPRSCKKVRATV